MITYEQLYHLNLTTLKWAVDEWADLPKIFREMDQACRTDIVKPFERAGWVSVTSTVAGSQVSKAQTEFEDAAYEVTNIYRALKDAYDDLDRLKNELRDLVDTQAEIEGLRVDPHGVVAPREDPTTEPKGPLSPEVAHQKMQVNSFQGRINELVTKANKVDHSASCSLRRAVHRKGEEGFIGKHSPEGEQSSGGITDKLHDGAKAFAKGFLKGGFTGGVVDAATEVTGFDKTKGVSISGGLGMVMGVDAELGILTTKKPDGGTQLNYFFTAGTSSAGWDFGASAQVNAIRSNADDWDQIKGAGWDKGGSIRAGPGISANHQTAIGSENSEGEQVSSVSAGLGVGLGFEASTGFSRTYGGTIIETDGSNPIDKGGDKWWWFL